MESKSVALVKFLTLFRWRVCYTLNNVIETTPRKQQPPASVHFQKNGFFFHQSNKVSKTFSLATITYIIWPRLPFRPEI